MLYINRKSRLPIYQQIYDQLKKDILNGSLPTGSQATSTRALAKELQVGRNSIESAYDQLVLEGYFSSVPGSGYFVNSLQFDLHTAEKSAALSPELNQTAAPVRYSFQYGSLDAASFPNKLWRRLTADILDDARSPQLHLYGGEKGDLQLRQQLQRYLYQSRGVVCEAEQIVLCSGIQSALEMITDFLPHEKAIAMENPCYDGASVVFQRNGYDVLPIPVCHDGIDLSALEASRARMVYTTPSHQFPMGFVLPVQRRYELLQLANRQDMIILEDDYDSELRYNGRPIPSLQSLDGNQRVIYLGTFSKALSPGLRISYMVLPSRMLSAWHGRFAGYHCTVSALEQRVVSRFMADGHWEKHIRKVCVSQKRKHDLLVAAIHRTMGDRVKLYGQQAGLHLLLEFQTGQEDDLIRKALAQGVHVCPVSPLWLDRSGYQNNALILGYGMIQEQDILPAVELLHRAWFE